MHIFNSLVNLWNIICKECIKRILPPNKYSKDVEERVAIKNKIFRSYIHFLLGNTQLNLVTRLFTHLVL